MCDELVLNELQLLAAMYDTDDVRFNDSEIAQLVENGIPVNDSVSLSVRLNDKVVLDVRLPLGYPKMERLSAYCRLSEKSPTGMVSSEKVRAWENKFNQMLTQNYLSTQGIDGNSGDELPSVLGVIQWCNDSFPEYPVPTEGNEHKLIVILYIPGIQSNSLIVCVVSFRRGCFRGFPYYFLLLSHLDILSSHLQQKQTQVPYRYSR